MKYDENLIREIELSGMDAHRIATLKGYHKNEVFLSGLDSALCDIRSESIRAEIRAFKERRNQAMKSK